MALETATKLKNEKKEGKDLVYIERGGQIVGGFLGKELGKNWERQLPGGVTKDMVYVVPQSYGYEWRLGYLYIKDTKTREEFYKEELNWSLSQPEEGIYDPRKKEQEKQKIAATANK